MWSMDTKQMACDYQPGSVANLLAGGTKLEASSASSKSLFSLFSTKQETESVKEKVRSPQKSPKDSSPKKTKNKLKRIAQESKKKKDSEPEDSKKIVVANVADTSPKKKKLKRVDGEIETKKKKDSESDGSRKIVSGNVENSSSKKNPKKLKRKREKMESSHDAETHSSNKKRKKQSQVKEMSDRVPENDIEELKTVRTVYVGNLPVIVDKKALLKLFKKCGEVESVRLRGAAPADASLPKKAVVCKKAFHDNSPNIMAYIRYVQEESVEKAVKLNGHELGGRHIRVDMASSGKQHDYQKSIFVGNLPFDADEEALREHFLDCGEMENVRIVRDSKNRIGKGFGFIQFKERDCVFFALKLDGKPFQKRNLRLKRCTALPSKDSNKSIAQPRTSKKLKGLKAKGQKEKVTEPSANKPQSFQGIMAQKVQNIKLRKKLRQKRNLRNKQGLIKVKAPTATQRSPAKFKGAHKQKGGGKPNKASNKKHMHFTN